MEMLIFGFRYIYKIRIVESLIREEIPFLRDKEGSYIQAEGNDPSFLFLCPKEGNNTTEFYAHEIKAILAKVKNLLDFINRSQTIVSTINRRL